MCGDDDYYKLCFLFFFFKTGSFWIRKLKDTKSKRIAKRTVTNHENKPPISMENSKVCLQKVWRKKIVFKGPKGTCNINSHSHGTNNRKKKLSFLMQCAVVDEIVEKLLICSYTLTFTTIEENNQIQMEAHKASSYTPLLDFTCILPPTFSLLLASSFLFMFIVCNPFVYF